MAEVQLSNQQQQLKYAYKTHNNAMHSNFSIGLTIFDLFIHMVGLYMLPLYCIIVL